MKELATALEKVVELLDSSAAGQAGEKAAALLKHVRTALDGGLQKRRARAGTLQQGGLALAPHEAERRAWRRLKKKCKKGEEATKKLVARFTGRWPARGTPRQRAQGGDQVRSAASPAAST